MSPVQLQRLYLQIILTQCISLKQGGGGFVSVWVLRFRDRYKKVLPLPKVGKYFSNIVLYNFVTIKNIKKNSDLLSWVSYHMKADKKILLLNTS